MKENYDVLMEMEIKRFYQSHPERKPTLLLHVCCAPCSTAVLEYLVSTFRITLYYYNPNVADINEYEKRYDELVKFLSEFELDLKIEKKDYLPKDFIKAIKDLEGVMEGGERCFACYRLRLEETAKFAKQMRYDYFASVLSISPLKKVGKINEIGKELEEILEIRHLPNDFKKKNRYLRSVQLSKEFGLYRQDYCGCIFSQKERT